MPFTLSHPAAAVPLARGGLVLSALVVGSMSPDFLYFLCLSTRYQFGHTFIGIFLFDIPVGLTVLWLFHKILKYPLLALFPVAHQQCLMRSANGFHFVPLQRFLLIILSLFIGALTHIAWDSLTHQSGWVVVQLPILSLPIIETSQVSIKVYKVLQYGSTLLGATLLLYWYLKWLKQAPSLSINALTPLSTQTKWLIIFSIGLSASFVAGIYGFVSKAPFTNLYSFYKFVGLTVVAGILCVFVELMIFSAFWHLNKLKHRELWLTKG